MGRLLGGGGAESIGQGNRLKPGGRGEGVSFAGLLVAFKLPLPQLCTLVLSERESHLLGWTD